MNHNSHFTAFILDFDKEWFFYDGMKTPSVKKMKELDVPRDFNPTFCLYSK